ncbi:DUF192 domain-containing protein [Halorubrum sp. Eb13]|uniref:DUF192 domain-containing protein n=1 Tax=Halorubrum sp. Eb13 TaxID=1383843 RepID=UPI000B998432|nr:DUF192 domain-containing protein [Halorubrum sp. Eb13]OYR48974.1 hypothetical protein DJ75_01870 [Halorubrum sp. Eb13]
MRRRDLLAAMGAGSVGGFAGCAGVGPTASDGEADGERDGKADDSDGKADDSDGDGDGADRAAEWPSGAYADYDVTLVEARTPDGDRLGRVTAAVAETGEQRFLGLSDAETLPEDAGMLFVFPAPREDLTFVMREMSFGIDIVYADAEGTIVEIHNAPEPGPNEDGSEQTYPGSGRYVLEVPYKWTDRHGVAVGDVLMFEL